MDDVQDAPRLGREAADPAFAVEDDDRDVDGGQQVQEVAVDLRDLLIAALELVVDGGQLLVRRLQLFLRRLELLVHALELFVPRDQLLVGRAEIVVRPPVLLDERLQILLRRHQLVLEPRKPPVLLRRLGRAASRRPSRPWARTLAVGRDRLFEQHDEERLLHVRVAREREHHEVARPRQPVLVDLHPVPPDGRHVFLRLGDRRAQRGDQPGTRHLDDVALRVSGRRLQKRSGLAAELEDLHPLVDEDARRGVARQQHAVEVLGDVDPAANLRPRVGLRDGAFHPTRDRTGARSAACSRSAVRAKILFALSTTENSWAKPEMLSVWPSSR